MACKGIMVMFSNTKHCNWFSQPCVVAVTSLFVDILTTLTHYNNNNNNIHFIITDQCTKVPL